MRCWNATENCWRPLIAECIRVKAEVVSADEREGGERRILNFGHTVGHALEAETGYKRLLHGEAVGWGMIAACAIGEKMKLTDRATAQRIIKLGVGLWSSAEDRCRCQARIQATALRQEDDRGRAALYPGNRNW